MEVENSVIFYRVSVHLQLADQAENIDRLCKLVLIGTQAVKRKMEAGAKMITVYVKYEQQ